MSVHHKGKRGAMKIDWWRVTAWSLAVVVGLLWWGTIGYGLYLGYLALTKYINS